MDGLKKEIFNLAFAVYRVTGLMNPGEAMRKQLREKSGDVLIQAADIGGGASVDGGFQKYSNFKTSIESMRMLFELGRSTRLIKSINADVLIRECRFLEVYFEQELASLLKRQVGENDIQNDISINLPTFPHSTGHSGISLKTSLLPAARQRRVLDDGKINDSLLVDGSHDRNEHDNRHGNESRSSESIIMADGEERPINDRQGAIIDYLRVNREAKINDLATIFSNRFSLKTLQRDLARLILDSKIVRQGDKRWAVYRLNGL